MKSKSKTVTIDIIPRAAALIAALVLCAVFAACFGGRVEPAPTDTPAPTDAPATEAPTAEPTEEPLSGLADFVFDEGFIADPREADAGLVSLEKVMGSLPHITVHVGEYSLPYCEGTEVFASPDSLGSLGFLSAAAGTVGALPDWAYRGAAYIAKNGSRSLDPIKLGAALNTAEKQDALALLPTRFAPRFNKEKELEFNYRVAGGFVNFLIEKYGRVNIGAVKADKAEFIEALGLGDACDGRYEGLLDGCTFSYNTTVTDGYSDSVTFPFVLESETYTLYAQPLTDCPDCAALEALLYKLEVGKQLMRQFIEEHADEYLYVCRFDDHVKYYMLNSYGFSFAQGSTVVLRLESKAILHETIHQWIMPKYYDHWYYEGLADFLALQGEGKSIDFANSMARLAFMHPDTYSGAGVADYNSVPASARVTGDDLTYDQSCSLIAYICETYTLDPILAVSDGNDFDRDFERAFGKTFEEVVAEWRIWLG